MKNKQLYISNLDDIPRIVEEYEYLGYNVEVNEHQIRLSTGKKEKPKKEEAKTERRTKDENRQRGKQQ